MTAPVRIAVTWSGQSGEATLAKLQSYLDRLGEAGAEPFSLVPGQHSGPGEFDGLLLAGGPDVDPSHYHQAPGTPTLKIDPDRDALEVPLARGALAAGVPVLGICRGFQLLNVVLGGSLYQDIPSGHRGAVDHREGARHEVTLAPDSRLARLARTDRLVTNSYHHQGIELPGGLARGLVATAWAPDGVIEAFEPEDGAVPGYLMAVQWHPEKLKADDSQESQALTRALFSDFVAAVVADRERRRLGAAASTVLYSEDQ